MRHLTLSSILGLVFLTAGCATQRTTLPAPLPSPLIGADLPALSSPALTTGPAEAKAQRAEAVAEKLNLQADKLEETARKLDALAEKLQAQQEAESRGGRKH